MKMPSAILVTASLLAASGAMAQDSGADDSDRFWSTECTGPSRSANVLVCNATQSILFAETRQLLFQVKVVSPAGGRIPVMQLQGPLNVFLPGGFTLSVDGVELAKVAVSNCNQRGCFGALQLEPATVASLKQGESLRINFFSAPETPQFVETPLAGFTRAMDAILSTS